MSGSKVRKLAKASKGITKTKRFKSSAIKALTPLNKERRRRALDAISLMRRHRSLSLAAAAKEAGTSSSTVQHYAGSAFYKRRGRYRVTGADRLRRELVFYDALGQRALVTHSSRQASEISKYHNAIRAFLIYGDDSALREFEGRQIIVGGVPHTFLTDRRTLSRLARAGELNFLEIYKS